MDAGLEGPAVRREVEVERFRRVAGWAPGQAPGFGSLRSGACAGIEAGTRGIGSCSWGRRRRPWQRKSQGRSMTKVAPVVVVSLAVLAVGSGGAFAQSGTDREPSSSPGQCGAPGLGCVGGRFTGSAGIRQAADHIIAELEAIGASPLPGVGDFRLPFEYTGSARDGGSTLRLETGGRPALGLCRLGARALVLGVGDGERAPGVRGLRAGDTRDRRIQLRQLCDPRRRRQDRAGAAVLFRRTARESCARCSRATRVSGSRRPSCAGGGRGAWWW